MSTPWHRLCGYEGMSEREIRQFEKLRNAIRAHDLQQVQRLLDSGIDPRTQAHRLLRDACDPMNPHQYEMVKLLLERGVDPNAQDPFSLRLALFGNEQAQQLAMECQWHPILATLPTGSVELIRLLLEHGADVYGLREHFWMSYGLAERHNPETARQKLQLLLRAGLPRDIPEVQEVIKEHPWVLE